MYVRKSSKKRKYLIVKLLGTSSSDRSLYVFRYRCSGCINRWDVLIIMTHLEKPLEDEKVATVALAAGETLVDNTTTVLRGLQYEQGKHW
jgi:hypothetical protein